MLARNNLRFAAALSLSLLASGWSAAASEQVWQDKCALCHGEMAQFAERSLCLADAMPALRDGGETLDAFLKHHGRLSSGEIETMCQALADELKKPLVK